jgi:hypothetical protein
VGKTFAAVGIALTALDLWLLAKARQPAADRA